MQAALGSRWTDNRAFSTAVLLSLLLHGALLFSFTVKPAKAPRGFPGPIIAHLAPQPAPAAAPVQPAPTESPPPPRPTAEPVLPQAPLVKRPPKPVAKSVPRAEKPAPAARTDASPPEATPAAPSPQGPGSPTAVPSPATGPLASVQPSAVAPSADEGTLQAYRLELLRTARHYKRYPRVAMDNNWEGKVVVKMVIGGNGLISGISVLSSAGYPILDKEAVDMIRKAKPLVPIPGSLRGREFSVEIPVIYSLKDPG